MKNLYYMPLTAALFHKDETYREILPQYETKYIRCYWGSEKEIENGYMKRRKLIIGIWGICP